MRIVNCNRFTLGGRKDITLRPRSRIQMILGTNGSGKSSFMELCFSPLSPNPTDFDEGGRWEFKCSIDGHEYHLSADYDRRKYRFLQDDEELNPGGTITVQDVLVEQYFGYTRQIHGLLIMTNRLTEMSPRARGDVISMISREDLSYAYGKFREWTKELNSNKSVMKFLTGRIAEEETKLMPEEDLQQIRENISTIKTELRELMSLDRPATSTGGLVAIEDVYRHRDAFMEAADEFLSIDPVCTDASDREELVSRYDRYRGVIETLEIELRELGANADRLQSRRTELESLSDTNINELEVEVANLEGYLNQLDEKTIDIPDELLVVNESLVAQLITSLGSLRDDPDQVEIEYREAMTKSNQINEALNKANYTLTNIESRIQDMMSVGDITCPSCNSVFKPGINESDLTGLQERLLRGRQYVFELGKRNTTITDEIGLLESHRQALDAVYRLRDQHYSENRGLFMYIDQLGGLKAGKSLISHLSIYSREAINRARKTRILDRLEVLHKVLQEHSVKNVEIVDIRTEYAKVEQLYNQQFTRVESTRTLQDVERRNIALVDGVTAAYERTMDCYQSLKTGILDVLKSEYIVAVDTEISKRQSTLAINEQALSNNDILVTNIKDLKNQLGRVTLDVESYKTMVDAINPKTGLIAERMYSQIGSKIDGMNKIISKIWNYDFIVKMPDPEEGSLDYRFPIVAEGQERADIRLGSGSMRDIVDTAFAILTHHSLGLEGYPIYLDEFDSPFDGVHTNNMVHMVKDLADSGKYSHVVVISHDESIQNAFPDAEILVLDDRNLDSNSQTNTHVVFS